MTKEGPCHGMTIKPWQAEVWFRLGPERINVPIQFFFFFPYHWFCQFSSSSPHPTSLSGVSQEEGAVDLGKRAGSLPLG